MLTFTRASLGVSVNINMNANRVMAMIMTRFDTPKFMMAARSIVVGIE